ncbi:MAG: hypothetical protein KDA77_23530, partial [Planctomycetaceae bacterium]|nr:hypothetical protein [Planctomycetaceae bacterium]
MLLKRISDQHCLLALLCLFLLAGCENKTPQPASPTSNATVSENSSTQQNTAQSPAEKQHSNSTPVNPAVTKSENPTAATPKTASSPKTTVTQSTPKPLFKDWPTPALAIVLTGERHGYLEPCGCTQNQTGGVSLLANLFQQIEDRNWPVTAFDLGGLVKRNRRQSQIKYETILAAMKDMKYAGVGLGPQELRFGADIFLQLHNPEPKSPNTTPTFLAANILILD